MDREKLRAHLDDIAETLEKMPIYVNGDGVWINCRIKGSAMWGLQDADPNVKSSFFAMEQRRRKSLELVEELKDGLLK